MAFVHWDEAALRRALHSREMRDAVEHLAGHVADKVRDHAGWDGLVEGIPGDMEIPLKVTVHEELDGVEATVFIAHPAGLAIQAKHGALTRAAADLGLEVNG